MNDSYEYIEAYFQDQLNDAEKKRFEERCIHDESFAGEVAFFITTTEGIRQSLLSQKQQQWTSDEFNKESALIKPLKKPTFNKWYYVTAACLLFAVAIYFLYRPETPHQLANTYISEHLMRLSQTMNASKDSLQQGIAAFNNKDYNAALQIFEEIYRSNPQNFVAKKYIGFVYLATKNYDKALQHFDELAKKEGLYKNPGLFLK